MWHYLGGDTVQPVGPDKARSAAEPGPSYG